MSQTFAQYQTIIGGLDPLTSAVYSRIGQATPLLQVLNVFPMTEKASLTWLKETGLPTTSTRSLNGVVTSTAGTNAKLTKEFRRIASLVSLDDQFNAVEKADQIEKQGRSMGLFLNELLFKGDTSVDADGFDGLEKYTTDNSTTVDNGTGALSLSKLDEAITEMDAQLPDSQKAFYMNTAMYRKFQKASRAGLLGTINLVPNNAGQYVMDYNGIPLKQAGVKVDGTQVLPFDEGTGTDETSIYLVDERAESIRGVVHNPLPAKSVATAFGTEYPLNINMLLQQRETNGSYRIFGITDLDIVA
jgi:hypothetical protein